MKQIQIGKTSMPFGILIGMRSVSEGPTLPKILQRERAGFSASSIAVLARFSAGNFRARS